MVILEIESYEPYHIGNKLNPVTNFDGLKTKLKEKLEVSGYSITEKSPSGQQIILGMPSEVLGIKNDVRVELNHLSQALNVIGTNPHDVSSVFKEITSFLPDIGYEIENLSLFFEIVASIIIKSSSIPIENLENSVNLDFSQFNINDIPDIGIIGMRIGGENATKSNNFTLAIEPSPTSPNSRFLLRLQYRSKDKENVEMFYQDLDGKLKNLLNQLE